MKKEISMILKLKISDEEKANLIDILISKQNIIYIPQYTYKDAPIPQKYPYYYPINYCETKQINSNLTTSLAYC